MKKIFTGLIISLGLISCHTNDGKVFTYEIINNCGMDINVVSFITSERRESLITSIGDGEKLVKHFESDPPLNPNVYSYVDFFGGDSIVVHYGDDKQQIYVQERTCERSLRNPLNVCVYSDQKESFTFTEEDYQNAAE